MLDGLLFINYRKILLEYHENSREHKISLRKKDVVIKMERAIVSKQSSKKVLKKTCIEDNFDGGGVKDKFNNGGVKDNWRSGEDEVTML